MFKPGFVFFSVLVEDEHKFKFMYYLDFNSVFYFVKIDKLICFFKMGCWRDIFIIILLVTLEFIVQIVY